MTFLTNESSLESGQPIEVYEILANGTTFRYTSAEDNVTFSGNTYEAIPIKRSETSSGPEERDFKLTIEMPTSMALPQLYTLIPPAQQPSVTITKIHRSDLGTPDTILVFKGQIESVGYERDMKICKFSVIPEISAISRNIPRRRYRSLCNHVLYDSRCTVSEAAFTFTGLVSAVSGNVITVTGANGEADDYYTSGYIRNSAGTEFRSIIDHTGNDITVFVPFPTSIVGESVTLFAGCDHTIATCKTKFDNVINFGGYKFVPKKNIFESGLD